MYTSHSLSLTAAAVLMLASNVVNAASSTFNSCQPAAAIPAASIVSTTNNTFMATGLCSETCSTGYFALYKNSCLCISTFTPSTSTTTPSSQCGSPCPGYPVDTCGGNIGDVEFYSLYSSSATSVSNTTATTKVPVVSATSTATHVGSGNFSTTTGVGATVTPSVVPVSGAGRNVVGFLGVAAGLVAFF